MKDLDIINMVWGNPQWIDPDEEQNYNLNFSRQQHHDMGPQGSKKPGDTGCIWAAYGLHMGCIWVNSIRKAEGKWKG